MARKILQEDPLPSTAEGLTVGQFCSFMNPRLWHKTEFLAWPPDVFALVGLLLLKSGAYCRAVSGWAHAKPRKWAQRMTTIGRRWRENLEHPPKSVQDWHQTIVKKQHEVQVLNIGEDNKLWDALLHLCAAADEACRGVGFELYFKDPDPLIVEAGYRLAFSESEFDVSTLCREIHHSIVRVLPKLHTPQSGITIRSLTHHLALCPAGDVKGRWVPQVWGETRRQCLNLLLVPWPPQTSPAHFSSVDPRQAVLSDMPDAFGFFDYHPLEGRNDPSRAVKGLVANAREVVDRIDGVIFPELALTPKELARIRSYLLKEKIFLISGVREPAPRSHQGGKNYLSFDFQYPSKKYFLHFEQNKHHRWRLDKRQIVQYGLGSALDVSQPTGKGGPRYWWEHIEIGKRDLYFVPLEEWLTVCALICEDLARQDPVAELVRAVGPNLVIAILMDGPQLPSRWPARYATVLAEDPGSSVLTFTSLGMSELSRPPSNQKPNRTIALWKDGKTGEAICVELPAHKEGVVLSISGEYENEWTADGRQDDYSTGYPTLTGMHFLSSSQIAKSVPKPTKARRTTRLSQSRRKARGHH